MSTILTVYLNTKNDVIVYGPRSIFCAAHFWVVRFGNAIARFICRIVRAIVDKHASP